MPIAGRPTPSTSPFRACRKTPATRWTRSPETCAWPVTGASTAVRRWCRERSRTPPTIAHRSGIRTLAIGSRARTASIPAIPLVYPLQRIKPPPTSWRCASSIRRPSLRSLPTRRICALTGIAGNCSSVPPNREDWRTRRTISWKAARITSALGPIPLGDGPALKRVVLVPGALNAALQEEVVVSGVENLQVQYALDVDGNRSVDQYVNAGAGVSWSQVEAVRIWLLVRAPIRRSGLHQYHHLSVTTGAVTPSDDFRRVLVTKTVHLHN